MVLEPERLAILEGRLRPLLVRLPTAVALRLYSHGRRRFLARLSRRPPRAPFVPAGYERSLWGLRFRSPLFNAAGMWKRGEGAELCHRQGAGAYLAGTTTHKLRTGNRAGSLSQPFAPYPTSGAASNWLGLPNEGHQKVASRIARLRRHEDFPIGVSLAADPGGGEALMIHLADGLRLYEEAGVDFLEVNESCPNTEEGTGGLGAMEARLGHLAENYLKRRARPLPVIVKLSCDTDAEQVGPVIDQLLELGFDGVNFGNTSTAYSRHRQAIAAGERRLFDVFTERFGGGLSGRPLAEDSLRLVGLAAERVAIRARGREFHVIRTGGVESAEDVRRSLDAGASLCQWYTGYFEAFGRHGHQLYREIYRGLERG